jgi:hypothetical protein
MNKNRSFLWPLFVALALWAVRGMLDDRAQLIIQTLKHP